MAMKNRILLPIYTYNMRTSESGNGMISSYCSTSMNVKKKKNLAGETEVAVESEEKREGEGAELALFSAAAAGSAFDLVLAAEALGLLPLSSF